MNNSSEQAPDPNKRETARSTEARSAPTELDEHARAAWELLPEWRNTYDQSRRSVSQRTFLSLGMGALMIAATGGTAMLISTIWRFTISGWLIVQDDTLVIISVGILTAAATVVAIVTTFIIFLMGAADSERQQAKASLLHTLEEGDLPAEELAGC
ncbi:MAG: hypothetical protein EXR47_07205 [Dehalococcoidia bacterium]|nr:hypothetical protein [Dehalococcoidia bacterium]